ncbi:MAG TPA: hypothetical protein VF790_01620 [Dissulfurispiraceae bacterium]
MFARKLSLIVLMLALSFSCAAAAYGEDATPVQDNGYNGGGVNLSCARMLLPSWLETPGVVKSKKFVLQLKICRVLERSTACSFTVMNCSGKDAWLYLDKSSYLSDDAGTNYALRKREIGGSSAEGDGFVKTFLQAGNIEDGILVFDRVARSATKLSIGVAMTGGEWAGDSVKALFRNVPLNWYDEKPADKKGAQ